MSNILEYLDWRGDLPMETIPFCTVDALIFSKLVYADLSSAAPADFQQSVTLEDCFARWLAAGGRRNGRPGDPYPLFEKAAGSARFGRVRVCGYRSVFDEEKTVQFAAVTFLTSAGAFAAFRGTDDSFVGWREDAELCFSDETEGQREAAAYAAQVMTALDAPFYLGGHSKGGNFAVFAASALCAGRAAFGSGQTALCSGQAELLLPAENAPIPAGNAASVERAPISVENAPIPVENEPIPVGSAALPVDCGEAPTVCPRLRAVYSFDGPGVSARMAAGAGFAAVRGRIEKYIPESSIVGVLLPDGCGRTIVRSDGKGVGQHNVYTWQVLGDRFETADERSTASVFTDETVQKWMASMDEKKRQEALGALFDALEASGCKTFAELKKKKRVSYNAILRAVTQADPARRKEIVRALKAMAKSGGEVLYNSAKRSFEKSGAINKIKSLRLPERKK